MIFSSKRDIQVIFTKEHKYVFNKNNRKEKHDYILNVNKIKKVLFDNLPIILNKTQVFILNFEVQKMFHKALTINNKKYTSIIYINSELSPDIIENISNYLNKSYGKEINFEYIYLNKDADFFDFDENINKIKKTVQL